MGTSKRPPAGAAKRASIRKDLLDQLVRNGTAGRYYHDLVEDYMAFWDTKLGLLADVAVRGPKVLKLDSRGQEQITNNESIEQLIKTNSQMLRILDSLGIRPVEAESTQGEDDDL